MPAPPAAAAASSPAPPAARPGGITLLAVWQFANAFLLGISTLGMLRFLLSGPGIRMRLEVVAVFGGLALVVFAALASGVGLLQERRYGRSLLLPFAWLSLLLFPLGTVIAIFVLRYIYQPEIKARFEPRDGGAGRWPAWVIVGFAAIVLGAGAMGGMTAAHGPEPPAQASTDPKLEQAATRTLQIGILAESGDHLVPGPDNLSALDVAYVSEAADEFGHSQVSFQFTPEGAAKMERLTGPNIGRQIGFLVDGRLDLMQPATIQSVVSNNAQVSAADPVEARKFVQAMQPTGPH